MSDTENPDKIQRFLLENSDIRGEIVTLSKSFHEACLLQDLPKNTLPLFGEFLAGACLIGALLKREGIFTLQAQGKGPVRVISAETTHEGHLRGILKCDGNLENVGEQKISSLFGKGNLFLTLDPEKGQRYQGIVPMEKDSLSACLSDYFEHSEQVPTQLLLFADESRCGGLLIQCLPMDKIKDQDERSALWESVKQLCATISVDEFFEVAHETLLYRLFHEQQCRVFEEKSIRYFCSCTKERSANAITALGKDDALELVKEKGSIALDCQYCGEHYAFDESEVDDLFRNVH